MPIVIADFPKIIANDIFTGKTRRDAVEDLKKIAKKKEKKDYVKQVTA